MAFTNLTKYQLSSYSIINIFNYFFITRIKNNKILMTRGIKSAIIPLIKLLYY